MALEASTDQLPPIQVEDIITTVESPQILSTVEDVLSPEPIERSTTPSPPTSSPPPLSPAKGDVSRSCDHAEEWREPQLDHSCSDKIDNDSCSSLDTDQFSSEDADEILNEIDQSANCSQLSAAVAKGMHDSLGTLSSLSEDVMVSMIM